MPLLALPFTSPFLLTIHDLRFSHRDYLFLTLQRWGRWEGKFPVSEESPVSDAENPVAVEVSVKDAAGKLSGRAAFYVIRNKDNKPQVVGKTESELIDPQFDGTTLKFAVKSKGQQPGTQTKVEMRMKLISNTEAALENLEDNSSPVFKMKKVHFSVSMRRQGRNVKPGHAVTSRS